MLILLSLSSKVALRDLYKKRNVAKNASVSISILFISIHLLEPEVSAIIMKVLIVLAGLIAFSAAGVVDHVLCGAGRGTVHQVRISDCMGATCDARPGVAKDIEVDMSVAAAATSLHLHVHTFFMGQEVEILDEEIPNSSVTPGTPFTIRFQITPSTLLIGNTVTISSEISNAASEVLEACAGVQVRVSN